MKKFILALIVLVALPAFAQRRANRAPKEITPEQKLQAAQQLIGAYYVEDVKSDTIVDEAIRAMITTLDPHSAYTTPEETKEFTEPLEGKFSGIGVQFTMQEDTVYVIQTVPGGPSEKVGILAGDRIIAAGDTVIAGKKMKNTQIMKYLRGPKGSVVVLKVKRGPEIIDFSVTRDDIPINSVDETFMADPSTGYIRVTRFAESTGQEVRDAIARLRGQGMKNLIIDLSDNGGGYLGSAFDMAAEFLPVGTPVVSTVGRAFPSHTYTTELSGDFLNGRIVVIANQNSASASEILSGALQDNDRALIVGRRTFGKGLVQRPFMFPDGSMIRLTVARYYTPSGRCIQKPYDSGQDDYSNDIIHRIKSGELSSADSIHVDLSQKFSTLTNNRTIYGGGGIIPDVFVPIDTTYYSVYYRDLLAKGAINRLCIDYVDQNRKALKKAYKNEDSFIDGFEVTDDILNQLRTIGEREGVEFNEEQFNTSLPWIRTVIKAIIGRDLFDQSTYFRIANPMSPEFREALEVITDADRYNSLLRP